MHGRYRLFLITSAIGAAAPAAAQSFAGARIEANVGYDRLSDEAARPPFVGAPGSLDGVRLGVAAGYDVALTPAMVVGAEAGMGWSTGKVAAAVPQNARVELKAGRDFDLAMRLGVRAGRSVLVYGKVGYANSRFDFDYASAQTGFAFHSTDTADGWRVGIGAERRIGRRSYLKSEYHYTFYADEGGADQSYGDNGRHQLLIGLGVRF